MNIIALPAFSDNYIWLLHDGRRALVVDPGDAKPVLKALQSTGLDLEAILVTHHHPDHTAGVSELREATGATVWGPAREAIPEPFIPLHRPVGPHPPRLCHARPAARTGAGPRAVVRQPPRLHAAHDRALQQIPVPHR
jgi:glyoxylase-like metal-dependent hydrolase (beta-lactamase superfamily II)